MTTPMRSIGALCESREIQSERLAAEADDRDKRQRLDSLARAAANGLFAGKKPSRRMGPAHARQEQPDLEAALWLPFNAARHERPGLHYRRGQRTARRADLEGEASDRRARHLLRRQDRREEMGADVQRLPYATSSPTGSAGRPWPATPKTSASMPTRTGGFLVLLRRRDRQNHLAAPIDGRVRPRHRLRRPHRQRPDVSTRAWFSWASSTAVGAISAIGVNRFFAFDGKTGDVVWIVRNARPCFAAPITRIPSSPSSTANGCSFPAAPTAVCTPSRCAPASASGVIRARPASSIPSPVVDGNLVYIAHGEENPEGAAAGLGRVVCVDASKVVNGKPALVWEYKKGIRFGLSSLALARRQALHSRRRRQALLLRRQERRQMAVEVQLRHDCPRRAVDRRRQDLYFRDQLQVPHHQAEGRRQRAGRGRNATPSTSRTSRAPAASSNRIARRRSSTAGSTSPAATRSIASATAAKPNGQLACRNPTEEPARGRRRPGRSTANLSGGNHRGAGRTAEFELRAYNAKGQLLKEREDRSEVEFAAADACPRERRFSRRRSTPPSTPPPARSPSIPRNRARSVTWKRRSARSPAGPASAWLRRSPISRTSRMVPIGATPSGWVEYAGQVPRRRVEGAGRHEVEGALQSQHRPAAAVCACPGLHHRARRRPAIRSKPT